MSRQTVLAGLLGCYFVTVGFATTAFAGELGFSEAFALAADRNEVLQQLTPGSEEHFYYSCLHLQQTQQFEQSAKVLELFGQRFGRNRQVIELELRQALLTYDKNPQQSIEVVRRHLGVEFNHRRQDVGEKPQLPTQLAAELLERGRLLREAFAKSANLEGIEDSAFEWLIQEPLPEPLSPERRRQLLQRLQRPGYPGLVELIRQDLSFTGSRGFGSLPIHQRLLLAELDELLKRQPELINQQQFVHTYLSRLVPSADAGWQFDRQQRLDHLIRLWTFVSQLPPSHHSLKAHVLYHRLAEERKQGRYDKKLFLEYLRLPRQASYLAREFQQQSERTAGAADLNADFQSITRYPIVGGDEPLVREFLSHFFLEESSPQPYESLVDDGYLRRLFAEVKIVNGLGDAAQWYAMLPPDQHQALRTRVDLDFDVGNPERFGPRDPVAVDVFVKNVPHLLVKVFELNAENAYRQTLAEIEPDVNLDGLVANATQTHDYSDPPLRRVRRHFEFPTLNRPGVFVVDFIGNGVSSRVVIRKGQLRALERITAAGHAFTVLDDADRRVLDARLWLHGHEYVANDAGEIVVPFSDQPGGRTVVLSSRDRGLSSLATFLHQAENYALSAGLLVDREALLAEQTAQVVVHPRLTVNGVSVPVALLEEPKLTIHSVDLSGIAATKEVRELPLHDDRESTVDFVVPRRLATLTIVLSGQVRNRSQNKKVPFSVSREYQLNSIDKSRHIEDLHLSQREGKFALYLLGKTGEPKPDRAVHVTLKHRDFRAPIEADLRTDPQGRVELGVLADIDSVKASSPDGLSHSWSLVRDRHSSPAAVHRRVGQPLAVPLLSPVLTRSEVSLLEIRGGQFVVDHFEKLSLANGLLQAQGLPAGDFELRFKRTNQTITLRIATGEEHEGYILGAARQLEVSNSTPLQLAPLELRDDAIRIRVSDADAQARVHVIATRFWPAFDAFQTLASLGSRSPLLVARPIVAARYAAVRQIGDEYRYILDRRLRPKFPGVMLDRPSLLLNPWALRSTETETQQAAAGSEFSKNAPAAMVPESPAPAPASDPGAVAAPIESNLDFLPDTSLVLTNLVPKPDGTIDIPRELLGARQYVRVLAVGTDEVTERQLSLPETPLKPRDLRLVAGLNDQKHFTQQQRVTVVPPTETLAIENIATAKFEVYDSLARVFSLYASLRRDPRLPEFAFLLRWPKYSAEQKREWYSKFACHELNFFLYRKDPAFFTTVVKPYLANKFEKTFLDLWLLELPVDSALEPWNFEQLNVVERILLSQRIESDRELGRQHIRELLELVPTDLERGTMLYRSTLRSRSLERNSDWFFSWDHAAGLAVTPESVSEHLGTRLGYFRDRAAGNERQVEELREVELEAKKRTMLLRGAIPARRMAAEKAKVDRLEMLKLAEKQYFQVLDQTQEWAENQYYQVPVGANPAERVAVNAFWRDYSLHPAEAKKPFLSRHFAEASNNLTEMLFALAVLDLPFEAEPLDIQKGGNGVTIRGKAPMIAVHEEIRETTEQEAESPLQITENFFQLQDRYRTINNEQRDKFVTDEFLVHTVYGAQVVVTNPGSAPQQFEILQQIPVGAVAINGDEPTHGATLELRPFSSQMWEYYFYFPVPGDYGHYPVHAARKDRWIAAASSFAKQLHVVATPTQVDRDSWQFVSQQAKAEEVLAYVSQHNLLRLDLDKIAFRLADRGFFEQIIRLLRSRHVYHHTLWSYGLRHQDPVVIQEYLKHSPELVGQCGDYLVSPLLVIDPTTRGGYQHLEYQPLVNARAHVLGSRRRILNDRFAEQYERLLKILGYKRELDDNDRLAVTYYLLLQDRLEEASKWFEQVHADRVSMRLQYDYFSAYLALCREDLGGAEEIASRHVGHPVARWKQLFATLASQVAEARGAAPAVVSPENRDEVQGQTAAMEPTCELQADSRRITIRYQNVPRVSLNFYLMDVEVLFSRSPFGKTQENPFGWVRPSHSVEIDLPVEQSSRVVEVPPQFQQANVLVEVTGAGVTKSQPLYANSLAIQWRENYGQLQVRTVQDNRPLSKVYVKTYARMKDGSIQFFKDGYTDVRGRFDYASLSTNTLESVERFAVLVLSEEHGSTVRELAPPQQ